MAGTVSSRRRQDRPPLDIGALIAGRYRVDGVLGVGGMGTVFDATHVVLGRRVALKVVPAGELGDAAVVDLLLDEARCAVRISHPNIAQVFDAGVDEGRGEVFLAMERLEGQTLRALLEARGRLPADEAVALLAPIMDTLAAVHDAGTVHRDVKPENIFLATSADGAARPTLLDFGIARVLTRDALGAASHGLLGTPSYMPPEQRESPSSVDARADQWALAVVLAEVITGRAPPADARAEALDPRSLPEVPAPLARVLTRAAHADPALRFESMRALRAAALDAASTRPPRRALRPAAAALLTVVLGAAGTAATRPRPPRLRRSRRPPPRPRRPRRPPPPATTTPPSPHRRPPTPRPPPPRAPRADTRRRRPLAPRPPAPPPAPSADGPWFAPRAGTLRAP
ncbi:MAG: serine/threonine-protein kinase [Polyangiales bacterium]